MDKLSFASTSLQLKLIRWCLLSLVVYSFFLFARPAEAATVMLTVNGGASSEVIEGESVLLEWYIDGNFSACSIDNGVGPVDISSLPTVPATGSRLVVPTGESVQYVLSCDGMFDVVTTFASPEITLSIDGGGVQALDTGTGEVWTSVRWESRYATECDALKYEESSNPGVLLTAKVYGMVGTNYTIGYADFADETANVRTNPGITHDTTFYLTCRNVVTGTENTESITLTVLDPGPPPPVDVMVWSNKTEISPGVYEATVDPLTGWARGIAVAHDSDSAQYCERRAFLEDGVTVNNAYLFGFTSGITLTAHEDLWIRIATTTIFEVECYRDTLTLNGITYPPSSDVARITVRPDIDPLSVDRTTLDPVSVVLYPVPATAMSVDLHPVLNTGVTELYFDADFADKCLLFAYRDDGSLYYPVEWSATQSTRLLIGTPNVQDVTRLVEIGTTTRFRVECSRIFDTTYYPPGSPEYDNAIDVAEVVITAVPSAAAVSPVFVEVMAGTVDLNSSYISSRNTSITNMALGYPRNYAFNPAATMSASTPFSNQYVHPDTRYDVLFVYCDESDGVSEFRFSSDSYPNIGTVTTDSAGATLPFCLERDKQIHVVATNLTMTEGETVTIECDRVSGNESCSFYDLIFVPSVKPVTVVQSPTTGFANINISWQAKEVDTGSCTSLNAVTVGGAVYPWTSASIMPYGSEAELLSTSTTFGIECTRDAGTVTVDSTAEVVFAGSASTDSVADVNIGECYDEFGNVIDAPYGFIPDPVTHICIPAVDLAAATPMMDDSASVADAVAGTYDNMRLLTIIENLGPGALPAGSNITHRTIISLDPYFGLPSVDGGIDYFNGSIDAPVPPETKTTSGILVSSFDDIPFGNHQICASVNRDGTPNFPEDPTKLANNTNCVSVSVPPPRPPMSISADRNLVVREQTVNIDWSVNVTYDLLCSVIGPGGYLVPEFNTSSIAGNPDMGTVISLPILNKSIYTMICREPHTNTTFTTSTEVEVVPSYTET